jgi:hypothetical protein
LSWQRALAGTCLLVCALTSQAAETVQSLRYGATLFYFYQQDYFDALTELMAAQQLQDLGVHTENAELLRGGINLSYGMDLEAEEVFTSLLSESRESADHNQAWFYLSKMAWQRGEAERASQALARMDSDYEGDLAEEADYLRASISLREGREQEAVAIAESMPRDSVWAPYLLYNLGGVQASRGDWLGSIYYFRKFDELRFRTEEGKSLRDRAYAASGFALMAAGLYTQAQEDFTRVRLDSPMSDRALLGYGWAVSQKGDYRGALSPWQKLSEQSLMSESVRESLLAIPYAYEQLGREGIALLNYQAAADVYSAELEGLQAAIDVFQNGDLLSLLDLSSDEAEEWLFGGDMLPVGEHAPYLRHLITRHAFQGAMRELRDLHSMAWHLADARARLQVLAQVDEDQRATWATVMEGDRRDLLEQRQQELLARVESLRSRLQQAEDGSNSRLLADEKQEQLWQRLERATQLAAELDVDEEKQRLLQLYRGLMQFEDSEKYPARVWKLQREMKELEGLAQQSAEHLRNVDGAIAARQQSEFSPRISSLEQRVVAQSERVAGAILDSEQHIRQVAVSELEFQARQLSHSLGQSRLAIARLYDKGSPEVPR